ncbi:MAG: hypothetical protein AW09_002610 [Candidatus Accumulibacter phosphatis]|uniref:Uncharacterized protein n=1 Tax=Candidatus Accumulibacter phosphatis TaxID=327160 RepID=A0A080LUC3_9PROT|nr:MAG: hypothetical protein AW09_002610 [Candidatus Accumulibacter phosphatis]
MEVDLILFGGGFRLCELRLARAARLDGLLEFLPGDVFLFEQGFHPCFAGARQVERSGDVLHVGRRLPGLRGEQRVVEFEQCLAFLDLVVEVDIEPGDRSGNLCADTDQYHRVECAIGRDRLADIPLFDGLHFVALFERLAAALAIPVHTAGCECEEEEGEEAARTLHGLRAFCVLIESSSVLSRAPMALASVARETCQSSIAWMRCRRALASALWALRTSRMLPTPAL